jgi:ATP-binding cassette, subfamily B, bacterial
VADDLAHRQRAERAGVVLEGGQIAEAGTHDQLLARSGHYAELFTLQARGYQESAAQA